MEPVHEVLTVGIPVLVVIAGILFNRNDFNRLQARLDTIQGGMNAMRGEFHKEFREFYRTLGQHDARLDHFDKR